MRSAGELRQRLRAIDGKGYKAYKELKGNYDFEWFELFIDHVQGDPFATPSRIRVRVPQKTAGFPSYTFKNKIREIALRDFLARCFCLSAKGIAKGRRGTGKSGLIAMEEPGQEILERSSVFVCESYVEARFVMGLPAFGRRIAGREAEEMFFNELPRIIKDSLLFANLDEDKLTQHIETSEDAHFLRNKLQELNLVAFVADGAILPRASGVDDRPRTRGRVVAFTSPESLRVGIELPNRGRITGMGIPQGITLIVGGGYHGKSTLLNAIQYGVYNHIPGDGREFVVTDPSAVKIRAEDGRRVAGVDISPFINNLPFDQDTTFFSTENASGSTSQAANIIEGLEAGTKLLLIDEDTSATNFMIRDHRMQELVPKSEEPITPFIDKARLLVKDYGVSTILVIGGSGDYFDIADTVICMVEYLPRDLTNKAKGIANKYRSERKSEGGKTFGNITPRIPLPESINPVRGKKAKIAVKGLSTIILGRYTIDLSAVEQLVDVAQTRAIGKAILLAKSFMNGKTPLNKVLEKVESNLREHGLDALSPKPVGDFARFRRLELAAAINRLRSLKVIQNKSD
ncbi:ATPase [Candidatus Woesearchaeota archaeon]|nr:MAG: ATPase [Candidatus Woesearchaeota archaeon]